MPQHFSRARLQGKNVSKSSRTVKTCHQKSRSGYDRLKRCDFRRWRNKDSDWADVVSCGRAYQIRGPATGKARRPTVESLTKGTDRRLVPAERSAWRPDRLATGTRGPRYRGAIPCRALYVSTTIFYSIRCGTRSQWRLTSALVMWSVDLMW